MSRFGSDRASSDDFVAGRVRPRSVLNDAVDLYVRAPVHERSEIRAFGDLVDGLMADAAFDDRRRMADLLAERSDTPPDLARRLAMDVAEVARPVILASPVLTASDLVTIMRRGPEHVRLVAQRLDLAPDIAAVLIDSNDAQRAATTETTTAATAATHGAPTRATAAPAAATMAVAPVAATTVRPTVAASVPVAAPVAAPVVAKVAASVVADPKPSVTPTATEPTAPAGRTSVVAAVEPAPVVAPVVAPAPAPAPAAAAETAAPMFRVPVRGEGGTTMRSETTEATSDAGRAFLALDAAGRWRAIQAAGSEAAAVGTGARRRSGVDPVRVGERLLSTAVARDDLGFRTELATALGLTQHFVGNLVGEASGEALAVALIAIGLDERRVLSILLHRAGEQAEHARMQDLLALIERVGRRAAEHLVASWRGEVGRRTEVLRQTDAAERRDGSGPTDRLGQGSGETRATAPTTGRRSAV